MGSYGLIWTLKNPFGSQRTPIDLNVSLCTHMDPLGPFWTQLDPFRSLRTLTTHMDPYGPLWTPLDP